MSESYGTEHSKKEIAVVLRKIQDCVWAGHFTIALNDKREENRAFVREYNLGSDRQKQILLQIEIEDFCYTLQNRNIGFEHEVLYVFCPQVTLFNFDGEKKQVDVYTKFNIIDLNPGNRVVVISFHERKKPITHFFRRGVRSFQREELL